MGCCSSGHSVVLPDLTLTKAKGNDFVQEFRKAPHLWGHLNNEDFTAENGRHNVGNSTMQHWLVLCPYKAGKHLTTLLREFDFNFILYPIFMWYTQVFAFIFAAPLLTWSESQLLYWSSRGKKLHCHFTPTAATTALCISVWMNHREREPHSDNLLFNCLFQYFNCSVIFLFLFWNGQKIKSWTLRLSDKMLNSSYWIEKCDSNRHRQLIIAQMFEPPFQRLMK